MSVTSAGNELTDLLIGFSLGPPSMTASGYAVFSMLHIENA
jgi:hypothetical protein